MSQTLNSSSIFHKEISTWENLFCRNSKLTVFSLKAVLGREDILDLAVLLMAILFKSVLSGGFHTDLAIAPGPGLYWGFRVSDLARLDEQNGQRLFCFDKDYAIYCCLSFGFQNQINNSSVFLSRRHCFEKSIDDICHEVTFHFPFLGSSSWMLNGVPGTLLYNLLLSNACGVGFTISRRWMKEVYC